MRLIDADALKKDIDTEWLTPQTKMAFFKIIDNTSTVNLEKTSFMKGYNCGCDDGKRFYERPQGEWNEWTDERWGGTKIYCPYCKENALKEYKDGLYRQVKSNFCPNCGADMRGKKE